ncbi:MAG: hypothetical protein JXB33_04995 [Clostridia bacterium]|nr:hypothetical protein [Clostridia bacterium]
MKLFLKRSLKTTASYGTGMLLFTFFLIAPISMENNRNTWIAVYSFVFFVFTAAFLYKQMWKAGEKSRREGNGLALKPWMGIAYGFAGFLPFLLMEILYFIIYPGISGGLGGNIFHAVFRCMFGPMYFIIRMLGYTWLSYLISSLIIPLIAFAGFAVGTTGSGLREMIGSVRRDGEDFLD